MKSAPLHRGSPAHNNRLTIYYRDGATKKCVRQVSEGGRRIAYVDEGDRPVNLHDYGARDPSYLGPLVGFERFDGGSSMLRGLKYLNPTMAGGTGPLERSQRATKALLATLVAAEGSSKTEPAASKSEAKPAVDEEFSRLDQNGDGALSEAELGEERQGWLQLGDTDENGALDHQQWLDVRERVRRGRDLIAKAKTLAHREFEALDRDGDGKLSGPEMQRFGPLLELIDADGDGAISLVEHEAFRMNTAKRTAKEQGLLP